MGAVAELAEKLWRGEISTETQHPFTPLFAVEEVAARVAFVSSFANVSVIDTDEGLLLVDTGGFTFGPSVLGLVRGWTRRTVFTPPATTRASTRASSARRSTGRSTTATPTRPTRARASSSSAARASSCTTRAARPTTPPGCGCRSAGSCAPVTCSSGPRPTRAIRTWRLYAGWWDGNPAHLKPAPEADLAREPAQLAGGVVRLTARAKALLDGGELALASHLVELAMQASPDDATVQALRKRIYLARAEAESSLMARGIFRAVSET